MKFRRSYKGKGKHVYTITPGSRYMEQGMTMFRYPLRAEFIDGFFDSGVAASSLNWKPEDKELVEKYLLRHADFGHGLYLDESEPAAEIMAPMENAGESEEPTPTRTLCIASVETDGETRMCGKPTVDAAGEFCATHAPEFAQIGG